MLDEPSIGLHSRDTHRLIKILHDLRDLGNTILVVEHDPDVMRASDRILDLGPGAGENGGKVIAAGTYDEILKTPASLTGRYLAESCVSRCRRRGAHRAGGRSRSLARGRTISRTLTSPSRLECWWPSRGFPDRASPRWCTMSSIKRCRPQRSRPMAHQLPSR